jgi:hypothetical protein
MLLQTQPKYLARRFSPSRSKRGRPSIDDVNDDHHKIDNKDLMRSADDEVLITTELVEGRMEQERHAEVAASTSEFVGPNGTMTVREQDERKDGVLTVSKRPLS